MNCINHARCGGVFTRHRRVLLVMVIYLASAGYAPVLLAAGSPAVVAAATAPAVVAVLLEIARRLEPAPAAAGGDV